MAIVAENPELIFLNLEEAFIQLFDTKPLLVRSPGRVNLIGEHTDYNEGFVLPAAINQAIYMAVSRRGDDELHLVSKDLNQTFKSTITEYTASPMHWPDYILGVIQQLQQYGKELGGFNCLFSGTVPIGGGVSSSAALECAVIYALNEVFDLGLDKFTMVKLGQKAENVFVGVQSGIMDQFASMFGKKDHVIKLDCRSLEYEYVPFDMKGIKIVLFDTNIKHSLASSEYNTRRKQCEQGVEMVKAHIADVKSLRDVTLEMLEAYVKPNDPLIYMRCKYVLEENERLLAACEDLKNDDMRAFGKKMFASHEGLSKEYEVSCKELDFLVNHVKNNPAILGARMMGGGFGGCTINLVKEEAIPGLVKEMSHTYEQQMHRKAKSLYC